MPPRTTLRFTLLICTKIIFDIATVQGLGLSGRQTSGGRIERASPCNWRERWRDQCRCASRTELDIRLAKHLLPEASSISPVTIRCLPSQSTFGTATLGSSAHLTERLICVLAS